MIRAVARVRIAAIASPIVWTAGRKRPQTIGSEQLPLHYLQDSERFVVWKHAMRQAHGENLVVTDRAVPSGIAYDVIKTPVGFVPEYFDEALAPTLRENSIVGGLIAVAESRCEPLHHAQRVVPQRLHLHRLAPPRRPHPAHPLLSHPPCL